MQFQACATPHPPLLAQLPWACSSVVEHCVDIAGVASSILATPTIENPVKSTIWRGFCLPEADGERFRAQDIFGQILGISTPLWANSGHEIAGRRERNPDSFARRRRDRALPHDAASTPHGHLVSAVAHRAHITTSKRCRGAPKQTVSPAGKRRNAASDLHRGRDPPEHTPPLQVSWHSFTAQHGRRRACTRMCHLFTKHGVPRLHKCG